MKVAEILKMIESVDHTDNASMWKVDCYVEAYIRNVPIIRWPHKVTWKHWTDGSYDKEYIEMASVDHPHFASVSPKPFSRSRAALKILRPEGWKVKSIECNHSFEDLYSCTLFRKEGEYISSKLHKTEELAELYAIVKTYGLGRE